MLFEGLFSEVSSYSYGQMFEVDLAIEELFAIEINETCSINFFMVILLLFS